MYLFYDVVIFSFLLADGILCAILGKVLWKRGGISRKLKAIFAAAIFSWLVIFYGSFIEPRIIVVNEKTIRLVETPKTSIKAVLVSDFHVGPYKQTDFVERVVKKINALNPDVILIAGDFLFGEDVHTEYLMPLRNLRAKYGVYAALGNHDYEEDFDPEEGPNFESSNTRVLAVEKMLKETGIVLLKNSSVEVTAGASGKLLLGGVDEYWTRRADIAKTFKDKKSDIHKVLLTHNPDIVHEALQNNVALVLAGHTHAGQIRLPFLGSVPPIPDKLGRKYTKGLFQFGQTQLFITSGLGETGPRARLFSPPEIVVLEIAL